MVWKKGKKGGNMYYLALVAVSTTRKRKRKLTIEQNFGWKLTI
jgi:hypothetical protein